MMHLKLLEVLVFYDVPQVFLASDLFGAKYLCMLYSCNEEGLYKYLAVKISNNRLDLFKGKKIDLLCVYSHPEEAVCFDVSVNDDGEILADIKDLSFIHEYMLPDSGFYCNYETVEDDKLISESVEKGKVISCIAFSDTKNSHDIDLNVLSQALTYYQSMVRNCHIKKFGKSFADEANMRAYALEAASFDVHIQLNEGLNLFGESPQVTFTLQAIDDIFSLSSDNELEEKLTALKGHTLNYMRSFLRILQENQLTFKHKWVKSTLDKTVKTSVISSTTITRLYDYLNKHEDLEDVIVKFEGYFASGTVLEKGKWTFVSSGKKITGTSSQSNIFNGITLGEHFRYKIKCIEYQEVNSINTKIKERYELIECTRLN